MKGSSGFVSWQNRETDCPSQAPPWGAPSPSISPYPILHPMVFPTDRPDWTPKRVETSKYRYPFPPPTPTGRGHGSSGFPSARRPSAATGHHAAAIIFLVFPSQGLLCVQRAQLCANNARLPLAIQQNGDDYGALGCVPESTWNVHDRVEGGCRGRLPLRLLTLDSGEPTLDPPEAAGMRPARCFAMLRSRVRDSPLKKAGRAPYSHFHPPTRRE